MLPDRTKQEGKGHTGSTIVWALGLAVMVRIQHPAPETLLLPEAVPSRQHSHYSTRPPWLNSII
jgi:hypothetical protein